MLLPGSIPFNGLVERGLPDRSWLLYVISGYVDGEIIHKTSILKGIIEITSPLKGIIEIFSKLS